jgi:curved DNA-binding protein
MSVKDYYKILGIERTATEDEIKQSYRRLAMKYHPDRNRDDTVGNAEERFKEINEAYECLSDKNKKHQYDHGGMNDPFSNRHHGPNHFDFNEIFGNVFGQSFGFNPQGRATRQQSINVITISLEDAYNGKNVTIGPNLSINVPQGIRSGTRFYGNGALYMVDIQPHRKFKRSNDDLLVDIEITAIEAMIGMEAVLEHLDNATLQFAIPPGMQPGQIIKLSGKGMKNPETDRHGDLLVRMGIKIPTSISDEYKSLLKTFQHRTIINI